MSGIGCRESGKGGLRGGWERVKTWPREREGDRERKRERVCVCTAISLSCSIGAPWHVLMPRLRSKTNDLLGWLKLRYCGCFRVANGGTVRKQRRESRKGGGRGQARLGRYRIDRERTYACGSALVRSCTLKRQGCCDIWPRGWMKGKEGKEGGKRRKR